MGWLDDTLNVDDWKKTYDGIKKWMNQWELKLPSLVNNDPIFDKNTGRLFAAGSNLISPVHSSGTTVGTDDINPTLQPNPIPSMPQAPGIRPARPNAPQVTPMPNNFEDKTMETFDQYQIPREVAYGIAAAEGGKIGDFNAYNIGAYDNNPQNAYDYDSHEEGATAAAKLLSGQYKRADGSVDTRYLPAYEQRLNPEEMLRLIMEAGYAGDPATWKQRSIDTGGAGSIYDYWDQFVKDTPAWKKWAGKY